MCIRDRLLPNGSRIVGVPGNAETVRGFSGVSMVLVDEAARVKDEMFVALEPMLAVGEGDMWLMSTPKGRSGFFYEAWEYGGCLLYTSRLHSKHLSNRMQVDRSSFVPR